MFRSMNRILRWTKGYHRRLYLGSLCSFLATWAAAGPVMLAAWALGLVIESAREGTALDPKLPWLCLGGLVLLILLRFVCAYWKNRLQESIGTERAAQQRLELGDLLKRVSLGYFSKNNLGDILAALTTELSTLELQSMKMVDTVINGYLQVLVIVLCMAFFCPEAALVAVVGVLLSAFALRGIGRQSARTAPVGHRAQEALSGAAIEYIHGLPVVKSFGQEGVSSQRFFEACRANKDIRIKNEFGFVPWNCLHLFSLKAAAVGLVLTAGWQALALYGLCIALLFGCIAAIGRRSKPLTLLQTPVQKRRLSHRTRLAAALILLCIPATLYLGFFYLGNTAYYPIAFAVLLECMVPFFLVFEGRKPQARELVLVASLCALGVAGRAAFFMLPQFKPVLALTIISGVALGGETGFLVGAMTMLASNVLFSQGPWTPFQMFAMGIIGFLAGVLFRRGWLRRSRAALCVFGAISAVFIYGGVMNPVSALLYARTLEWKVIAAYYVTGFPMDCVHAAATVFFLLVLAEPMLEKLDRIKIKYGLVE